MVDISFPHSPAELRGGEGGRVRALRRLNAQKARAAPPTIPRAADRDRGARPRRQSDPKVPRVSRIDVIAGAPLEEEEMSTTPDTADALRLSAGFRNPSIVTQLRRRSEHEQQMQVKKKSQSQARQQCLLKDLPRMRRQGRANAPSDVRCGHPSRR